VIIEDNVWLAARVVVLKGVRIGRGSVVGVGSVVTRDIPAGCLAVGSPARVIRHL
jgi:acetyltransferase-like isoleucine patch superfamily enzyme